MRLTLILLPLEREGHHVGRWEAIPKPPRDAVLREGVA